MPKVACRYVFCHGCFCGAAAYNVSTTQQVLLFATKLRRHRKQGDIVISLQMHAKKPGTDLAGRSLPTPQLRALLPHYGKSRLSPTSKRQGRPRIRRAGLFLCGCLTSPGKPPSPGHHGRVQNSASRDGARSDAVSLIQLIDLFGGDNLLIHLLGHEIRDEDHQGGKGIIPEGG